VLVPGDTPLLNAVELDELLDRCEADGCAVGVVPDRHGTGTNGLVLSPPIVLEPSFGPGSFNRHMNHAKGAGVSYRAEPVPSLAHDIDTPEDLAALADALEGARTIAPRTRGALRQLERSGVLVS
jgi:2-phospho-L-lactate guanylyltransferase